jgi:hypothetical protein
MPKAKTGLMDEIRRAVVAAKKGPRGWFDKLPPERQAELNAIAEEFFAGKLEGNRTAVAKSIHKIYTAHGLISVGCSEVLRWLNQKA